MVRLLSAITGRDVQRPLGTAIDHMEALEAGALKDFVRGLMQHVQLDPAALNCRIRYRIRVKGGNRLASPGQAELDRTLRVLLAA